MYHLFWNYGHFSSNYSFHVTQHKATRQQCCDKNFRGRGRIGLSCHLPPSSSPSLIEFMYHMVYVHLSIIFLDAHKICYCSCLGFQWIHNSFIIYWTKNIFIFKLIKGRRDKGSTVTMRVCLNVCIYYLHCIWELFIFSW